MVSLLEELRVHSTIDLDCNDDAVALQFKPFQDMTSNQLIVLGQLKQASHAGILPKAVELAKGAAAAFPSVDMADLTVDFATVLLGKVVASHLHPEGYVHAQTLPSKAYDTEATIAHALRLVKVYGLAEIPQSRVCIKIPSTKEGIEACRTLEMEHNVRTLATTCFTLAQGLAAAQAGCTYVAPYVNPLIVHLDPSQHTIYEDPLDGLTGMRVTFEIQKAYAQQHAKTKVLAASLVTAEEVFALCGIQHITLSSAALALIQKTPLDARFEGIRDRSLACLQGDRKVDDNDAFFSEASLEQVLADPAVDALQRDALLHFGRAEEELREMAKKACQA